VCSLQHFMPPSFPARHWVSILRKFKLCYSIISQKY
jgi:hypothetical protein